MNQLNVLNVPCI